MRARYQRRRRRSFQRGLRYFVPMLAALAMAFVVPVSSSGAAGALATTDIHVLAFNDLHGTLEADSLTIYGRFAGGAASLAKAVKDLQSTYGERQATVMAGDNIGASPLANGLFFEEPISS